MYETIIQNIDNEIENILVNDSNNKPQEKNKY